MQSKNYSVIGGFYDEEGTALVRVILSATGRYLVLRTLTYDGFISYPELVEGVDNLSSIETDLEFKTHDVLSNFNSTAKNYLLDRCTAPIRVKNTTVISCEHDMVMNVLNAHKTKRLSVNDSLDPSHNALTTITQWDRTHSENPQHYTVAMALLHSIGFLEAQMIKYRVI